MSFSSMAGEPVPGRCLAGLAVCEALGSYENSASSMVFQAPQPGHRPDHLAAYSPQAVQA